MADLVAGQVSLGQQPAVGLLIGEDRLGDIPDMKQIRAFRPQPLKRAGQVREDKALTNLKRTAFGQVEFGQLGVS